MSINAAPTIVVERFENKRAEQTNLQFESLQLCVGVGCHVKIKLFDGYITMPFTSTMSIGKLE
jgi:hypothetical protein